MRGTLFFLTVALAAAVSGTAKGAATSFEGPSDTGLFGLILTKPIVFEECPTAGSVGQGFGYYDKRQPRPRPCYQRGVDPKDNALIGSARPLGTERVLMYWPYEMRPPIAVPDSVIVLLVEGTVEHIYARTAGLAEHEADTWMLLNKFGNPDYRKEKVFGDVKGRADLSYSMKWNRPGGVTISLFNYDLGDHFVSGLIAATKRGRDYRNQLSNEIAAKRQRL